MASATTSDERYESFLRYYSQDQQRLFAYIRSLVFNHADAQDIFQRCCLTLWKNFEHFDVQREFLPWACRIAFNEVRNFMRVSARDRLRFDDELLDQLAHRREADLQTRDSRLDALQSCIGGLDSADRELVRIAYDDQSTVAEFAKSSGKSTQTVYNRLCSVRQRLMECIQRKLAADEGAK